MRVILIGLLLSAAGQTWSWELDRDAALADIQLAQDALSTLHAGYDRYTSEDALDRQWRALANEVDGGITGDDLFLGLSRILATLGCDHTLAEFPEALVAARETARLYLPFRFRLFGEPGSWRMLVEHSTVDGLRRGDEIVAIDGDPVSARVEAIWPLISVDGRTTHVRGQVIADSSEFLGSGFDHFDPLLSEVRDTVQLTVVESGGSRRLLEADRIGFSEFRRLGGDGSRYRNFSDADAVSLTIGEDGQAVLSVATFVNYRTPVDPATIFDPIFQKLRDLNTQKLIVDMRQNGGGSVDVQVDLMRRLIKRSVQPVAEIRVRSIEPQRFRPHLSTWNQVALDPDPNWFIADQNGWLLRPEISGAGAVFAPHPLAFEGKLVVLIGPANSSGATTLIGAVAEAGDALLIGEATGGNQAGSTAGILFYLTLPHSKIRIRIPAQRTVTGFRRVEDGAGFAPDVPVPLTLSDWRSDRDPAMAAAAAISLTAQTNSRSVLDAR